MFSANYNRGKLAALQSFGVKEGMFRLVVPSVAGGVIGRKGGEILGKMTGYPQLMGDVIGPILGTSIGMSIGDQLEQRHRAQSAPQLQLDETMQDIPDWANQLAMASRAVKRASESDVGIKNMLLEHVLGPFAAAREGYKHNGMAGALRVGGGSLLGGLAGTLGGVALGKGIEKVIGREPQFLGVRLPHLLGGVGGVITGNRALESLLK
jgi:hypothetical protein